MLAAQHGIADYGALRLAEGLEANTGLKRLDLSNNRVTRDGAVGLAAMMERNTTLEALNLSYNRLEDEGAETLCTAIVSNPCGVSRYAGPLQLLPARQRGSSSRQLARLALAHTKPALQLTWCGRVQVVPRPQ